RLDATPIQCLRVPGPTFLTFFAALFTGGAFILSTFFLWSLPLASCGIALGYILARLWSRTSLIPEQPRRHDGIGLTLPLYVSGPQSVSWWGMLIMMLGDMTAFISLVFGYSFYWTVHEVFPPASEPNPVALPLLVGSGSLLAAWACTL